MSPVLAGHPAAVLSQSRTLFELGLVLVLAAAAPLIAQVLRLPSILLLLALGFGAGASGALDPNELLGENLVSTVVSIAVGIILFEAGLGLDFGKLEGSVARVYRRLVSLGVLVTWAVGTVAAYLLFDLSWEVAILLGAVLVVSGPTVVGPLLDFIRPSKTVNSVLKWEGTFADPIGATLGVVVFNALIAGQARAGEEVAQFLLAIGIGLGFGLVGGALAVAWARWFKPNPSQALSGTLMFVVAAVVCADLLRDDTGLITGLTIGAILANRPPRGTGPEGLAIQTAKLTSAWRERIATLSTFLIGVLFIILSARVSPHEIAEVGWVSLAFVAVLVLVGRPLAVGLATLGSGLPMRERAFIGWMAPRGIVAAATSSTFALGLTQAGIGGGSQDLIPITFIVIVATGLIYGLSGGPVARALGVASTGPGGVLLIGASPVGRALGQALQERGLTVLVATGNEEYAKAAATEGLSVYRGNPFEDAGGAAPSELDQMTCALAVSDDEAMNAIVAADLSEYFGAGCVYQLAAQDERTAAFYTRAQVLFDESASHGELLSRIKAGHRITVHESPAVVIDGTDADNADLLPMFVMTPGEELRILTAGARPDLQAGQELIAMVKPSRPRLRSASPRIGD
jgi:NhaP-type Na+/H+ or K+/H+ antiporter